MWYLKICLIVSLYINSATCEAPYAAAGWRPQHPFNLPNDYLPPSRDVGKERQKQHQRTFAVEINKERVDYAGQIQNNIFNSANRQPASTYLSPRKQSTDVLKVQRPPYQKPAPQFILQSSGPRPQQSKEAQVFQISGTQEQQQRRERLPLRLNQQRQFFPLVEQQQSEFSKPAQTYGPPSGAQEQKFTINYPDSRDLEPQQADSDVEEGARIAVEALNLAAEAYNRQQEGEIVRSDDDASEADVQEVDADSAKPSSGGYPASRATRGQYYVLGPDNRLQLVRFTTTQSEAEARGNGGFTAQLRYTPVGEINDPVFKYNSRGQVVRVFKK
ncbi:uncharacterized protein LOC129245596 [Anastrepha obliqua]|uniref:uncharacterized protein LOC129245596 n=1 Tax=Anastrepha obliqua TaxID=95512 RepID=UPI002409F128|nr:uncharacterized protein LOC129245596 [Anastrepha obliqua]